MGRRDSLHYAAYACQLGPGLPLLLSHICLDESDKVSGKIWYNVRGNEADITEGVQMDFFGRKRAVLLAVGLGTFMSGLDSSVVNMALPSMGRYFHAPLSTIEWTIMSYLLVVSSLLLAYGRLGDIYGHKRIYILGIVIFTTGSLFCSLSPSVFILIISRGIQAIGAGMQMATGPAIVTDSVPPQERGRALSVTAVSVAIALTLGPVVGGFLTSTFGWQSIFLINLPIGVFEVFLADKSIPRYSGKTRQRFDFIGAGFVFLALVGILLPLSLVEEYGWSNHYILGSIVLGLVLAAGFILWERRITYPMFDVVLFHNRLFSMSNLSALLNFMAQFTIILLIPFYLQQLRGLPPATAGILYMPMPLTTMLIAPISGNLSDRMDTRYLSSAGMAIVALGMGLLSTLKADSPFSFLIISLIIVGLGIGLFQTPNNSAIMGAAPQSKRGIASGMLATMRNVGMVLGVAISGAIFTSSNQWLTNRFQAQGLAGTGLFRAAFEGALHITYTVGAVLALLAVITSLVKGPTRPGNSHQDLDAE